VTPTPTTRGPVAALLAPVLAVFRAVVVFVLIRPLAALARRVIHRRLAGYRVRVNHCDPMRPLALNADAPRRVLVVGGGLAGFAAAATLGERGFKVDVVEKQAWLGGKLGAWEETFADGETHGVEHGFHAFFGSYYNLLGFLDRLRITRTFREVADYRILLLDGSQMGFTDLERTPWLNMFHIVAKGIFPWFDFVKNPQHRLLDVLANYEQHTTYAALDQTSFHAFAASVGLPERMQLMFNTFSRAFFARPEQMSMAALLQSFHLYYLSNEGGLIYTYPTEDHRTSILAPIEAYLTSLGTTIRRSTPVRDLARLPDGRLTWDGETYDHVVLATDGRGVLDVLENSPVGREEPGLLDDLKTIKPQNRYANLRLWLDRDDGTDHPVFTVVQKRRALDSISFYHRCEDTSAAWARKTGGAVLELHAYQLPADMTDPAAIRDALLDDLRHFVPSLRDATVVREHMQVRDDFSAFFVGHHARRPSTTQGPEGVRLAGDWVKLPVPAMLMEGAFTSGLYAANDILRAEGLREAPIHSVPLRGIAWGNSARPGQLPAGKRA
jgi:isorenieratene synthase